MAEAKDEALCQCGHTVSRHTGMAGACSWVGCWCLQPLKPALSAPTAESGKGSIKLNCGATGWQSGCGECQRCKGVAVSVSGSVTSEPAPVAEAQTSGLSAEDLKWLLEPHIAAYVPESAQPAERAGEWVSVDEDEAVTLLTEAMRAADRAFEKVGGSTRHHVRDCLIPELERMGLAVTRPNAWIPRHEQLPPLGVTVVVLRSGEAEPVAARLDDDGDWIDAETHEVRGVTHWMPLPPPPQPKGKP